MLNKGLCLLTIFVFMNNIKYNCANSDDNDNKESRKGKFYQTNFNFNHPPSVESYNPIPVAVVYDDANGYSESSTTTKEGMSAELNLDKDVTQTTTKPEESTTVPTKNINSIEPTLKSRALKELQIPVAVIYDHDSSGLKTHQRTKTDTSVDTSKRRIIKRKKQQNNTTTNTPGTAASISSITEKPQEKLESKNFMKRLRERDPIVPIIDSESYVFSHNGNFHYRYEGGDGTIAYSEGKLKKVDKDAGEVVSGGFSYTDKEGNDFSLSYTADENGYRPVGAHLPTPPPIPPAIARALKYLATVSPAPVTTSPSKSKPL